MNKKQTPASAKENLRKKENVERELGEGALGAIAGAAIGAFAGPPGMAVGAVVGGAIGAVAGAASARAGHDDDDKDERLDEEIGVTGGTLGAPNLKHPPAIRGTYSAEATGARAATSDDDSAPNEGPMPHDG